MVLVQEGAAQARCYASGRVWRADYSGLLTNETGHGICRKFMSMSAGRMTLERLDRASTAWSGEMIPAKLAYLVGSYPGIIVTREDQFEDTARYCRFLANLGVIRMPFLQDQLEIAQEWLWRLGARA